MKEYRWFLDQRIGLDENESPKDPVKQCRVKGPVSVNDEGPFTIWHEWKDVKEGEEV